MAQQPIVAGVVKVIHQGTTQNQPYANIFHIHCNTFSIVQSDVDFVAANVTGFYWTHFGPLLNGATTHTQTQAVDLTSPTGVVGFDQSVHSGSHPGLAVPSVATAACVSWHIVDRYRGGHPRTYLPAADIADIVQGRLWDAGVAQNYAIAANNFLSDINAMNIGGKSWSLVCVRYFQNHVALDPPAVRPITNAAMHPRIDSMRRRLGKETT